MTGTWGSKKKVEVPDIAESRPSVIGGEDVEGQGLAPADAGGDAKQ